MLKKLAFAPLFLVIFTFTCYKLSPLLTSYDILFSLDSDSLIQVVVICALLLISSLLFILFATFSQDWRIIVPVVIITASLPIIFLPKSVSWILAVGSIAVFLFIFFNLNSKLKTYLTFQSSTLLIPLIKSLATLLILVSAIVFYLSSNEQIKQIGFLIPDSLIDSIIETMPQQEQIAVLQDSIRDMIKIQVDQTIKPYVAYIPMFLSLSFFLTLNWISSILSLFLSPILWVIFTILTKSGFATFTTEMREVKKLVV